MESWFLGQGRRINPAVGNVMALGMGGEEGRTLGHNWGEARGKYVVGSGMGKNLLIWVLIR